MHIFSNVFRDGLKRLPQVASHKAAETPDLRAIFTPASHEGALDPRREIVVGDRGVGKSFWSSVLRDDAARTAISETYPRLRLDKCSASLGFSEDVARNADYPSVRVISSLLESIQPEFIWRAVILNSANAALHPEGWQELQWPERCNWIRQHPEIEERILTEFNSQLMNRDRAHLFVFDALDRLGNEWRTIRHLTRSLLTVTLEMRSFPALRAKIFIRPDMESDREIWSIRDGSKLKQNKVDLSWRTGDLYGFVWHSFLADQTTREAFIELCQQTTGVSIKMDFGKEQLIKIPTQLLEDEELQKKIFEALAGKMMGAGTKKGHPFTWIPKHLADAREKVDLRSFIIALRDAAKQTPTSAETAITHDQIKKGVQQASNNRVEQLKEDYAWISDVLRPLGGLETPNHDSEFIQRWQNDKTAQKIFALKTSDSLIPVEFEDAKETDKDIYTKLIDALQNIGVAERRSDGRLNIPDLFQVASGMLRRGGVRPIQ